MGEIIRAMTLLNESGDTTVVWTEEQDDQMVEIIRKKMAEGITFYVVEPRFFGILPPKKTPLVKAEQATEKRALAIRDEDLIRFVSDGGGQFVKTPAEKVSGTKREKDPEKVAKSQSVGIRPMAGG